MTSTGQITMNDAMGEGGKPIGGRAVTSPQGIEIILDCCATAYSTVGDVVFIENRNGIPHICIWADRDQQDPTHVVSLEGALKPTGGAA